MFVKFLILVLNYGFIKADSLHQNSSESENRPRDGRNLIYNNMVCIHFSLKKKSNIGF